MNISPEKKKQFTERNQDDGGTGRILIKTALMVLISA